MNKIDNQINLSNLKNITVSFSFWRGRRFSLDSVNGLIIKNISLNELITIVYQNLSTNQDFSQKAKEFLNVFEELSNKGYEKNGELSKHNLLVRLITKIKHCFANIKRRKLLKELTNKLDFIKPPISSTDVGKNLPVNNRFRKLPDALCGEVFKFLDPVSLFMFSRTCRDNKADVEKVSSLFNYHVLSQALKLWQDNWKSEIYSGFETIACLLMPFFPKEIAEVLDSGLSLPDSNHTTVVIRAIAECGKINPSVMLPLIEKAYGIAKSSYNADELLCYLAKTLAAIDPQKALALAQEIKQDHIYKHKIQVLVRVVAHISTSDLDQAFKIITKEFGTLDDRMTAYMSMLKECAKLDKDKAQLFIDRIKNEVETSELGKWWKGRLFFEFVNAYAASQNFDQALDLIKKNETKNQKIVIVDLISKHYGMIEQEKIGPFIEELLGEESCLNLAEYKSYRDSFITEIALAFIRVGELNRGELLLDHIRNNTQKKIEVIVKLAIKYKGIDQTKSVKLLEEAILLVDQIKLIPNFDNTSLVYMTIYALIDIAKGYILFDHQKALTLVKKAENLTVSLKDFNYSPVTKLQDLFEAYVLIDNRHILELINKYIKKPMEKATLLACIPNINRNPRKTSLYEYILFIWQYSNRGQ